jgi:hypothetical protein
VAAAPWTKILWPLDTFLIASAGLTALDFQSPFVFMKYPSDEHLT